MSLRQIHSSRAIAQPSSREEREMSDRLREVLCVDGARAIETKRKADQMAPSENMCVICHEDCSDVTTDAFGTLLGLEGKYPPKRDSRCYMLKCQHFMHIECMRKWVFQHGNTSCPMCRNDVSAFDLANLCTRRIEPQFHSMPNSLTRFLGSKARWVFDHIRGDFEFDPTLFGFDSEPLNQFGDEIVYDGVRAAWIWGAPWSPERYSIGNSCKSFIRIPITHSNLLKMTSIFEKFYEDTMETRLWEVEPTIGIALNVDKGIWRASIHLTTVGHELFEEKYRDVTYCFDQYTREKAELLGPLLPVQVADAEATRNASLVALMGTRFEELLDVLNR